jgi:putative ABC transport system ATP-binding protein
LAAIIRTEDLSKDYRMGGSTVQALKGVTLEIMGSEITAIMGPSGSGKSTLMNLLGFLDRPQSGLYLFEDQDVSQLDEDARAGIRNGKIGFVFQSFNLLQRNTAIENVELPLIYSGLGKTERRRRAEAALTSVGLSHRKSHWPHQLSGGEQQRVAIARALVNDPSLILADEPTGALDARTGLEILALFQKLNDEGRTIIVVTHDRDVGRHADRVLSLRDGQLIKDEKVSDPLNAAQQLSETYGGGVQEMAHAPV